MKCPYLAYPEEKAKKEFKKLIDNESTPYKPLLVL